MANNPNEISPKEAEALKDYINKNGMMSGCKNSFSNISALSISEVGETLPTANPPKMLDAYWEFGDELLTPNEMRECEQWVKNNPPNNLAKN